MAVSGYISAWPVKLTQANLGQLRLTQASSGQFRSS